MERKRDMWVPLKKNQNQKDKVKIEKKNTAKCVKGDDFNFIFYSLLVSFSDSRKSDRRNSSGQEQKVRYATRATRGYQKHGISPRIQVKIQKNFTILRLFLEKKNIL